MPLSFLSFFKQGVLNLRWGSLLSILSWIFLYGSCQSSAIVQQQEKEKSDFPATIDNPVLPGDFADPSIIRVGEDYYATATSSEWAPVFPILHSRDLEDWKIIGHVFPESQPDWSLAHYWAPEISYDDGKFFVYYTAKKRNGPLCVAVASSEEPAGPYTDHGPLICQEAGSIDGFQIRDDKGTLFLIWKEDGNSRNMPTPMWGQQMNEDRTKLLGEKFELFRNDPQTWEGHLVEGIYIEKRSPYYYAFYSGGACCGRECTYGVGVARSKNLRGPWEKFSENPIKKKNETWKCAGHGSMVQTSGNKYFFLYHAYNRKGSVYTGRQGLLDEIIWGADGWPRFRQNNSNSKLKKADKLVLQENFNRDFLSKSWQWPVGEKPVFRLGQGKIHLKPKPEKLGAVLAQRSILPDYEVEVMAELDSTHDLLKGLAAIGDEDNAMGLSASDTQVILWQVKNGVENILAVRPLPIGSEIYFKMRVDQGESYRFNWSMDGLKWNSFEEIPPLSGAYLPPWDRAVRIGLTSKGLSASPATFDKFQMTSR